jgi:hypothetical protein
MKRRIVRLVAVLAVVTAADLLALGVTEARAQYVAVPAADVYMVRVRPRWGRVYAAPVVDPMVSVASVPATTYLAPAPVIQTTQVVTTVPVVTPAPVVAQPVLAPIPVYTPTIMAAPVFRSRVYTRYPVVYGYPY